MGTSGGYVGLELRREERVPEPMWHGQPLGALWPPQGVGTACSSVTFPSWLQPTRPAARCMYNCLSLSFPGLVLGLPCLYVCLLHVSNPQHSSRLTSKKPSSSPHSSTITSFFKKPHQVSFTSNHLTFPPHATP